MQNIKIFIVILFVYCSTNLYADKFQRELIIIANSDWNMRHTDIMQQSFLEGLKAQVPMLVSGPIWKAFSEAKKIYNNKLNYIYKKKYKCLPFNNL